VYLLHHEISVSAESLHLAYLELKSRGELELFAKPAPITAPEPVPAAHPVQPHTPAPVKTVAKNFRNGQPIDDWTSQSRGQNDLSSRFS
jgi:hypothetical protein